MAKVMVSMPNELLAQVDAEARRTRSSRSAVLRGFAEDALQRRRRKGAKEIEKILRAASGHYGGDSAEQIKAGRPDP